MFVYIVCIVWATFFVYLAERQFKKIPYDAPADRKREGLLTKFLQRFGKRLVTKHAEQPVAPMKNDWSIATPRKTRHINVALDDDDEITIIIPNVRKSVSKQKEKSKDKHNVKKARSIIIDNNLPLNIDPAFGNHVSAISHNINVDSLDDKTKAQEEDQKHVENTLPKSAKRKVNPRIIMDVFAGRKQNKTINKTKGKKLKEVRPVNKELEHRRMVGDEIFRNKKVDNIIQSARKNQPVVVVNDVVVMKKTRESLKNTKNRGNEGKDEK